MRLHTAKPAFGLRCASPSGTKADALLRLAGLEVERVPAFPNDGPREKLPFLVLDDATIITDTWNIQRHPGRELADTCGCPVPINSLNEAVVEHALEAFAAWTNAGCGPIECGQPCATSSNPTCVPTGSGSAGICSP